MILELIIEELSREGKLNLIKNLVDLDKRNSDGVTPIMIASENGHLDVVEFLVKQGADFQDYDIDKRLFILYYI